MNATKNGAAMYDFVEFEDYLGNVGQDNRRQPNEASAALTTRQREVLQLLAEGHSMKGVANILDLSPRTIAFHKYRIMEELSLKTNADLVQFAIKHGFVSL
jgi:DNA-binding NarL/FixJ family response regulator